jgi:hypothetical protein
MSPHLSSSPRELHYCFALTSILILLLLIGIELAIALALARFGLAGFMVRVMEFHVALVGIFFRSFWIKKGVESGILLQSTDAPALFDIVDRLSQRLEVAPPKTVTLEMSANSPSRRLGQG